MRYEFGIFDYSQILFSNTALDCVPHFEVKLKQQVNIDKLKLAVSSALQKHPIFATKLIYDKKYYLETNEAEVIILKTSEASKDYGKTTNEYLWRITYENNCISFDFSHSITDGRGMSRFITTILEFYFDLPITYQTEKYVKSFEAVYDKKAKQFAMKKKEKGFSSFTLPHIKNGKPSTQNTLSFNTQELLRISKKTDSSPAAILLPLFSRAVYRSLPKKHNVCGYFTADFRKTMGIETGRNFIGYRHVTYTDKFEKFDIETLGTIYRSMMDIFLQPENISYFCTKFAKGISFFEKLKPTWLSYGIFKMLAPFVKSDTNIYLTYIGKLPFSEKLNENILDVDFMVYPDTGYCVMSALDFNGTMKLSICNNYKTDKIVPNLVNILKEYGIEVDCSETKKYNQAHYVK